MTSSELTVKRDALLSQIAAAQSQIRSGEDSISYQEITQMERALALIDRELALLGGTSNVRTTVVQHSRG